MQMTHFYFGMIKKVFKLDVFFQFSCLKPNVSKTKAVCIDSKINTKDTLCSDTVLQWTADLGITQTANLKNMEKLNFNRLKVVQKRRNQ